MTRSPGRRLLLAALLALLGGLAACGGSSSGSAPDPTESRPTSTTVAQETGSLALGPPERPARLVAPDQVTAPAPLLVLLHSYATDADFTNDYLGVTEQARERGLYVLLAEGKAGPSGRQSWDATSACCNFTGTPVDDVSYLSDLIAEAIEARPIDPARVYVLGHSNGGFMAYRLACDQAGVVVAVAVVAGADQLDEGDCQPSEPVSILHLHGTADSIVDYAGGPSLVLFPGDEVVQSGPPRAYPGALDAVTRWASRNGCDPTPTAGAPLDLDGSLAGAETEVTHYDGCAADADVQLDTIVGGSHVPPLIHERVGTDVLDWLLAHAR